MILLAVVVFGVLTVPLTGGHLARLSAARLRATPLIFTALAIQVVIVSLVPNGESAALGALHLASYVLAAVFLIANIDTPGMRVVSVGALANALAITANKGVLPASPSALRAAGIVTNAHTFVNSGVLAHPRLLFLGDVFAVPKVLPLANVFSIGDVLTAVGTVVVIHTLCRPRTIAVPACRAADNPVG